MIFRRVFGKCQIPCLLSILIGFPLCIFGCNAEEPRIPTGQEIVQLFDLSQDFTLNPQKDTTVGKTDYGNIIWGYNYSNSDHCLFDITVALAEGGSFLSSEIGMKMSELEKDLSNQTDNTETEEYIKELNPEQKQKLLNTIKSNTSDKRTIYTLPLAFSPSGSLTLSVLTSKDGKYDLMILIFKDFERDVSPEKQMKNPIQLKKSGRDVIEPLEEIVY